jgi:hypothetical protein
MIKQWFYNIAIAVSFLLSLGIVVLGACAIIAMQHGITELEESYAHKTQPQEHNDR